MSGNPLRIADFGPYTQSGQAPGDPAGTTPPPLSQMEKQVDFIANTDFANTLRLYTIDDQQGSLIDYAIQHDGLNVIPSVYLPNPNGSPSDTSPASWTTISNNTTVMGELNNLVTTLEDLPASDFSKIPFIVIGNEEISQVGGWSDTDIESAIAYVKGELQQNLPSSVFDQLKFTTAETYDGQYMYLWNNPNFVNPPDYSYNPADAQYYTTTNMGMSPDIDVIYANITAYWDGISVANAAAYVDTIYQKLQALYPGKEVVISETGWPSAGATITSPIFTSPQQAAIPSLGNEQTYWQDFLQIANQQSISFGAFEAYNEPNKDTSSPTAVENN
jgi:exo-beta-1,3-glucanase (GH17 family)